MLPAHVMIFCKPNERTRTMIKITVDLENCYGIKKLNAEFDFSQYSTCAVYAPNGAMKSSFAKTFQDIADDVPSKDRIFPSRPTSRKVIDENGINVSKDEVLVVRPYAEEFGDAKKTSTLLVNQQLRKEYESLHAEIDAAKGVFLKALKEQASTKKDVDKEISLTFAARDDRFYVALNRIRDEIAAHSTDSLQTVPYDVVFDDKVMDMLGKKDVKSAIESYIKKYNELLAASTYFKKGVFNYYNAATIAKQLADNGFFKAKHTIKFNSGAALEIASQKELEELIAKEKDEILKDDDLRKRFADIEKLIQKNENVRKFEMFLMDHEEILTRLSNIADLKEDLWKSYIKAHESLYMDLLNKYQAAEKRRKEIEAQASSERTQWEEVIEIFNDRFFVPFVLSVQNREAVILGQETIPSLGFKFNDGTEEMDVSKTQLIDVLSTGERKAFYILNVLFEIEARKKGGQNDVLIVVDDIADSFDYKNKYAIIQYLADISKELCFKQIILTHNFDFYRTIESRFVHRSNCFMVSKSTSEISLIPAVGIRNIFTKDWKPNYYSDNKKKIACIPFIRNLVEYTKGETDLAFEKLTSLLHWKADTGQITVGEVDAIYNNMFSSNGVSANSSDAVIDVIEREAATCLAAPDGLNFENKVVLAIATRLAVEKFMVAKINDQVFVNGITAHQTNALSKKYLELFPTDIQTNNVIQRVVLMTPENIHLNSFMYEPILDMSDQHLRDLYSRVKALQ